jgi:hypothetical protein
MMPIVVGRVQIILYNGLIAAMEFQYLTNVLPENGTHPVVGLVMGKAFGMLIAAITAPMMQHGALAS